MWYGSCRVAHVQSDHRVPRRVPVLLAAFERVDQDEVSIVVDPGLGDVRGAVAHEGGHVGVGLLLYQHS